MKGLGGGSGGQEVRCVGGWCATELTDGSMATGVMSARLERLLKTSLKRDKDIFKGHQLMQKKVKAAICSRFSGTNFSDKST